ncbi:DNA repair ATPase [Streptomyces sp. NBC_01525]|uniref:DNA repair ATPase n=1 Tax=Streptomyces sp. NBC_01525 TaxID=2903893 RepID=UPI003868BB00
MNTDSAQQAPDTPADRTPDASPGDGTYEVLRDRLLAAAGELAERARALNARRTEEFGGAGLELRATGRLESAAPCLPGDVVEVGGHLLFGHHPPATVTEPGPDDVFALYRRDGDALAPAAPGALPGLLDDPRFRRDVSELHRYYRQARLRELRRTDALLLAVFRTGERPGDLRVLRWRLAADGTPAYLDDQGERDLADPPAHDVTFTAATREDHVAGRHPHIDVRGAVYVSVSGGHLTLKAENDTTTPDGIHREPVDEPLQSLADAEVEHARTGPLILLRIRPYNEEAVRCLVYHTRTRTARRLDAVGRACRSLPDGQGLVFPGGYHLATGATKLFGTAADGLEFARAVRSPNGEDVLYVFRRPADGHTLLLPYNVIREEAAAPLTGRGHALFDDGTLAVLREAGTEAARVHPLQIWRTPFTSDAHAAARPQGDGPLARVGNAELVSGIADLLGVARMAAGMEPSAAVFDALAAAATRAADTHHWLTDAGLGAPAEPLAAVGAAATQVVEEFARVTALRESAADQLERATTETTALVRRVRGEQPDDAAAWVGHLTALRRAQGRLESLREVRYVDLATLDTLSATLTDDLAATARRAVAFLAADDAFAATHRTVAALTDEASALATVADAAALTARIDEVAEGLRTVTDIVATLDLDDTTVRTAVLGRIGDVLGAVNRARATLDARRRALAEAEGKEEFAARLALLGQSVAGALADAATPEECDTQLAALLLQVEDLEARFGGPDGGADEVQGARLARIAERRDEIHEAFAARKQAQLDARARHTDRLAESAARVLATVTRRARALAAADDIHAYFAADPLVAKVRATAAELRTLADPVRAGEVEGRLAAARQEAVRALRDRTDLYDPEGTLRLGRHRFAVTTQPLDLTLVPHGDGLAFAVTGTDYRAPADDARLAADRAFRDQPLASESPAVYRAEHLAALLLDHAETGHDGLTLEGLYAARADGTLPDLVRAAAQARYDEGYDRGVHDLDATAVLDALLRLRADAGLLRFTPATRAAAQLFWHHGTDPAARTAWATRAHSLARARARFGRTTGPADLAAELTGAATAFLTTSGLSGLAPGAGAVASGVPTSDATLDDLAPLGAYLFEELADGSPRFTTGAAARDLLTGFRQALGGPGSAAVKEYADDLTALGDDLAARHQLVTAWLGGYADDRGAPRADLPEAAAIELCGPDLPRRPVDAPVGATVDGLLGSHPALTDGTLPLRLDELLDRTRTFRTHRVPAHRAFTRHRTALLDAERRRLRLDSYRPQVMPAFVRNRLIDEVYLPLIGDNLATQLGTAGDDRRTDSQGLLLLLSPPGYGKTTLLEYVAARLGLVLVKVDGPALGQHTTSLDPAAAPDAAARREVEKISFALEMGSNVLLHLDDIQHTSPELLQKFIPLCDAQRRMEGVWNGRARSYDLRGKRFAVSMAGNPYTESGHRFRLPDMLANRADVRNLGDVLAGKEELFALSHIENALTANPHLAPLATRDRADTDLLIRLARRDPTAHADRLVHPYAPAELDQILAVLRTLLRVQETVLAVNRAYIDSAAQADSTRTEPPFLLQGSYRNTNKIAARLVPVMNDTETEALLDGHYRAEAQTLTGGAEANLLKLAELRGRLTPVQARRWAEIKRTWRTG